VIPLFKVFMAGAVSDAVTHVLESGFIGQGDEVDRFEEEVSALTPYPAVLTNSCTSAIHMVLAYLGIGPGDEVITTPLTCIATNAPIVALGATPVWADVDPLTGLIDPLSIAEKITFRTRAIIGVDWTGRRADYAALKMWGFPVIQDAAHGPLLGGDQALGDYTCLSFGPIKHLTSGDGGAVVTDNVEAREAMRLMRWYGLDRTSSKDFRCAQNIERFGMKWHMNDINAAIGRKNLQYLTKIVRAHRHNATGLYGLINNEFVTLPPLDRDSNYWVFPLLIREGHRDAFKAWMESLGVACSQVHARNDKHEAYILRMVQPLPGVDSFDARQVNIPCGWWLTEDDAVNIVRAVNSFQGAA